MLAHFDGTMCERDLDYLAMGQWTNTESVAYAKVKASMDMGFAQLFYQAPAKNVALKPPGLNARAELGIRRYLEQVATQEEHWRARPMVQYMCARMVVTRSSALSGNTGVLAARDLEAFEVLGFYGGLLTTASDRARFHEDANGACLADLPQGALTLSLSKRRLGGEGGQSTCRDYVWTVASRKDSSKAKQFARETQTGKERGDASGIMILGAHGGNTLRFINDYHNLAPRKTVAVTSFFWRGAPRILYYTIEPVRKGEELFTDYGDAFFTDT